MSSKDVLQDEIQYIIRIQCYNVRFSKCMVNVVNLIFRDNEVFKNVYMPVFFFYFFFSMYVLH